jgi:hypothetical protein
VPAFRLELSPSAIAELSWLKANGLEGRLKAVRKALGRLETEPRHPALNTHKYKGRKCPHDGDLFDAYAENNRPSAYRVFFCYPPGEKHTILIVDIVQHP